MAAAGCRGCAGGRRGGTGSFENKAGAGGLGGRGTVREVMAANGAGVRCASRTSAIKFCLCVLCVLGTAQPWQPCHRSKPPLNRFLPAAQHSYITRSCLTRARPGSTAAPLGEHPPPSSRPSWLCSPTFQQHQGQHSSLGPSLSNARGSTPSALPPAPLLTKATGCLPRSRRHPAPLRCAAAQCQPASHTAS